MIEVGVEFGGQTRATLMRNRLFAEAGTPSTILLFGAAPDLEPRREALLERGLLHPGTELLSIYDHYRTVDHPGRPLEVPLPDLSVHRVGECPRSDGSPYRVEYALPDGTELHEYLRPDGTPALRLRAFSFKEPSTWPDRVQVLSRSGELVEEHRSVGAWIRSWLARLVRPDEDTFLFSDSRFLTPHLAGLDLPRTHLVHLLHNIHVGDDRSWNGPLNDQYRRLFAHLSDVDAFVTLTERQRDDVAQRFGARSHLFVVPNPVDTPPEPEQVHRDPRLVTVVARLEPQKRLGHALRAFRRVLQRLPDARLVVYGDGGRREQLEQLCAELDLGGSVTFMGHDPAAREALWHSSAFLLTSRFEGYPLSTLESLSHGCPVVAYDVKYGPREQITDGVDGFVVREGDVEALADRVVELLEDPDLVARMSQAARRKALAHGPDRFLADWSHVLTEVLRLRPQRTKVRAADAQVRRSTVRQPRLRLGARGPRLEVDASVHLELAGNHATPADAAVTLDAVHGDGRVTAVPARVAAAGDTVEVRVRADVRSLCPDPDQPVDATLRLRVVCRNDAWETTVGRLSGPTAVGVQLVGSPG